MPPSRGQTIDHRPPPSPPFDTEAGMFGRLRSLAQVHRFRCRQRQDLNGVNAVYVVRSGLLNVCTGSSDGKSTIIELLYPGDTYTASEVSAFPNLTLSASLASECWRFVPRVLAAEIARDGQLANYAFQRQNIQRARLQLHVAILSGLTSEQRVAALLIEAASELGVASGDTVSFNMPWSRIEIAEYLALNADTLSRIMSKLGQAGIIARISRGQVVIRKWQELLAHCPLADTVIAVHKNASAAPLA